MVSAPLLRNRSREETFQRQGFVTLPFLTTEEASALRAAYHRIVPPGGSGMVVEYTQGDRQRMEAVEQLLAPMWAERLDEVFVDQRVVFSTFVVKYPGPGSSMFLHDDRTYVDERRHRAATLWIPLVDTSPELGNGSLQIVPGSQRLAVTMAGTNTPELFRPYERQLAAGLVDVAMTAGEGLLYDTRVLHASPPNLSKLPREAIAVAIAPRDAELIHVVGVSARGRRLYRVSDAFFVDHSPQELEQGVPADLPLVEEYEDTVLELPAELVAEVQAGSSPPEADVLVPPDLMDLLEGHAVRPRTEIRTRVGSLAVAGGVDRFRSRPSPSSVSEVAAVMQRADDPWLPASVLSEPSSGWIVGDPRVRVLGRVGVLTAPLASEWGEPGTEILVLRVSPGDRMGLRRGRWGPRILEVLEAPPLGAGVVGAGIAAQLRPGHGVELTAGDAVVWNHGPGPLLVLAIAAGPRSRSTRLAERLGWGRRHRRRLHRQRQEAEFALRTDDAQPTGSGGGNGRRASGRISAVGGTSGGSA